MAREVRIAGQTSIDARIARDLRIARGVQSAGEYERFDGIFIYLSVFECDGNVYLVEHFA